MLTFAGLFLASALPGEARSLGGAVAETEFKRVGTPDARTAAQKLLAQQRTMLHLFQDEARHGSKPELRAYAQAHIPLIQEEIIAAQRDERGVTGSFPRSTHARYVLPKPWPSITPFGLAPPTTAPEPEG